MTAPLHGTALQESRLVGDSTGRVRQLRGFQKGFREPSEVTAATRSFVARLGAAEVQERAERVFREVRAAFAYKRRELDLALADGSATVRTPDFDVNLGVEQDEEKPSAYRLVTQVAAFRSPGIVEDERFLRLFGGYCDRVVIDFAQAFDLAAKIDRIEDLPELAPHLDYDAHAQWFTLSLPSPAITIHVTSRRMVFALAAPGELRTLLNYTAAALAALGGAAGRATLPGNG